MPRRKKNGQSPARVPGMPPEGGSLDPHTAHRLPQGFDGAMANNFPPSAQLPSSSKEKIVKSMQEMFSHLDPEVIYIVLSECDFKVENAMDSLLELSVAAEVAVRPPSPVSGFERTAAALLSPRRFSESRPESDSSRPPQLSPSHSSPDVLTEDLDLLVEQELETLTTQQEEHHSDQYVSSFPPPPFPQQVLPELLQSSLKPGSRGASTPLDQLSTWEDETAKVQRSLLDHTHLTGDMPANRPKPPLDLAAPGHPLDLAASGRPSAFQVYKKQDPLHTLSDTSGSMPSNAAVGGARSKEPHGYRPSPWNLEAPAFSPFIHENQGPTFITPVAQPPSIWTSQPRHATPWLSPVSQAPLKLSATIPKSWAMPHPPAQYSRLRLQGKVLVLLRGAPGSGKSTLARALVEHNPGGIQLSTDDYFIRHGDYRFDPSALGEAHEWNHKRVKEAFERGANPIIVDNTNMQGWEMKPYVSQALKHGYKVLFREPDTWWKTKPRELQRRSSHNVPAEKIRRMLNGYERFVTVQSIMGSQMPEMRQHLLLENNSSQPVSSDAPGPDLVSQPGLTEGCKKSRPQLFSSLPDVSSIGRSTELGMPEDAYKSTESLNFQPTVRASENSEMSDRDEDMELDCELDSQLELNVPMGDQRIPDCIVESVMNEDQHGDEMPVAFSESIAQRVRRERPSRRSGFDRLEPVDLVKDTNQSDGKVKETNNTKEEAAEGVETVRDAGEEGMPTMLDFVGDWPSQQSLQQRQVRSRGRHKEGNGAGGEDVSQEANRRGKKVQSGPNITAFQKLLDLIQTGVADIPTDSSPSVSLSPNSEGDSEKEVEAGGSSRLDVDGVNNNRGELPDCVLDWKPAESCKARESRIDLWEGFETEREVSNPPGGNDTALGVGRETASLDLNLTKPSPLLATIADSLNSKNEADVCCDGVRSHHIVGEVAPEPGTKTTDVDTDNLSTENRSEGGAHVGEVCQSPAAEVTVEGESSSLSGGSQERKLRPGRRSGKQCKLALTFTQNCPASSLNTLDGPTATTQNINSCQNSVGTDVALNCLNLEPKLDPPESHLQPPPPVDRGFPTQTEPQDFALLWRLNEVGVAVSSQPLSVTVLPGDASRFMPAPSAAPSAAGAPHATDHRDVPYRVVHEKGTQVEEKELGTSQGRLESLRILSRHFKLVSFDTLEDLFDKCQQDLEWTTNLLLDSGERFFRDEDSEKEEDQKPPNVCGASDQPVESSLCPDVLEEHHPEDQPAEHDEASTSTSVVRSEGAAVPAESKDHPETENEGERCGDTELDLALEADLQGGAWGGSFDGGVLIDESRVDIEEEIASMDEVHRLLQAELDKIEREERRKEEERTERQHTGRIGHLDIQSVELKLSTEVALQLTELFGPVGVDPGSCSADDNTVQMDLNLAKLLHQKWKETIQEKQRQATLSFHLLQEGSAQWGEAQVAKPGTRAGADGFASLDGQPEARSQMPFMDHWNVSRPHISLRDIIKEEQAMQENVKKTRQSRADLDRRDGAALLKENQLYSLFPTIDRHFLQDIFRDHNYSLAQTELFLRSLLDEEPVKTVIAPEAPRSDQHRAASKEREKRQKPQESDVLAYQDTEDPEYEDFRAEASLQRSRQLESFSKATEAFKQGRKEVASFYAQQGHLHGKRMREANHRAAVQIFQRVNSSLLPKNILDLHGLHVDEALEHLAQVLEDKTADCEQGLCRPQLSIITGRGNHSQGGVARIRPAVIDYLTKKHYRFTEPKQGLVLVSLM